MLSAPGGGEGSQVSGGASGVGAAGFSAVLGPQVTQVDEDPDREDARRRHQDPARNPERVPQGVDVGQVEEEQRRHVVEEMDRDRDQDAAGGHRGQSQDEPGHEVVGQQQAVHHGEEQRRDDEGAPPAEGPEPGEDHAPEQQLLGQRRSEADAGQPDQPGEQSLGADQLGDGLDELLVDREERAAQVGELVAHHEQGEGDRNRKEELAVLRGPQPERAIGIEAEQADGRERHEQGDARSRQDGHVERQPRPGDDDADEDDRDEGGREGGEHLRDGGEAGCLLHGGIGVTLTVERRYVRQRRSSDRHARRRRAKPHAARRPDGATPTFFMPGGVHSRSDHGRFYR